MDTMSPESAKYVRSWSLKQMLSPISGCLDCVWGIIALAGEVQRSVLQHHIHVKA